MGRLWQVLLSARACLHCGFCNRRLAWGMLIIGANFTHESDQYVYGYHACYEIKTWPRSCTRFLACWVQDKRMHSKFQALSLIRWITEMKTCINTCTSGIPPEATDVQHCFSFIFAVHIKCRHLQCMCNSHAAFKMCTNIIKSAHHYDNPCHNTKQRMKGLG